MSPTLRDWKDLSILLLLCSSVLIVSYFLRAKPVTYNPGIPALYGYTKLEYGGKIYMYQVSGDVNDCYIINSDMTYLHYLSYASVLLSVEKGIVIDGEFK